jgi:DNA helicase-2/ATP-dependent DNA helicase PcrA
VATRVELDDRPTYDAATEQIIAQAAADADAACLADAICDPGPAEAYSAPGTAGSSRSAAS